METQQSFASINLAQIGLIKNPIDQIASIANSKSHYVTGSLSMVVMGLVREAKDVDLCIVNPTEEGIAALKRFAEVNPVQDGKKVPEDSSLIRLTLNGFKFDVFIVKKDEAIFECQGIRMQNIAGILKAKHGYNRVKDHVQLFEASRFIYNQASFTGNILNAKDSHSSGGYNGY